MNRGGIGILVTLLMRASRQHSKLAPCGLSDRCREVFELTPAELLHITQGRVASIAV